MIRIVTLGELPPEVLDHVQRRAHATFGLGCEFEGEASLPKGARDKETLAYDAPKLLAEVNDRTREERLRVLSKAQQASHRNEQIVIDNCNAAALQEIVHRLRLLKALAAAGHGRQMGMHTLQIE